MKIADNSTVKLPFFFLWLTLPFSSVLLSLIGSGLGLSVLGAAVYDIGRAFSLW